MKNVRALVDLIFHGSSELGLEESEATFLKDLEKAEPIKEFDKKPLAKALEKVGLTGFGDKIKTDPAGLYIEFDNEDDYVGLASRLRDGGLIFDLAGMGWVATFNDDVSDLGSANKYQVHFMDIGEVEDDSSDTEVDMNKLAKDAFKKVNDLSGTHKLKKAGEKDEKKDESIIGSMEDAAKDLVEDLLKRDGPK